MDADQVEQRLLGELTGARGEDRFTASSAVDLFFIIRGGATKMAAEGATSEADLTRARENLRRFLDEMEAERDRLGVSEFREETVAKAWQGLCPGLFPFC